MDHAPRSARASTTTRTMSAAATAATITTTTAATTPPPFSYTNTAKLPIQVVKNLISAVERRPQLYLRNNNYRETKRCDITPIWYEVSKDVNLPVDICRIKWGHLRDNFRKVYIRNNLSDATPTTWRFYNDMRFMEKPVAENIICQSRTGRKSSTWLNSNGSDDSKTAMLGDVSVPICELTEGYDRVLHQPSFSDISSFFDDSRHSSPPPKRTKFEGKNYGVGMSGDYTTPDDNSVDDNDDLNDDDFDEDAATDENDTEPSTESMGHIKTENTNNPGVLTIEVLDDEEEHGKTNKTNFKNEDSHSSTEQRSPLQILPFKNITVDATTNTDSCSGENDDADRLFLLSLLPFMQKVDERRKLAIRQKFQNVLIEEFG